MKPGSLALIIVLSCVSRHLHGQYIPMVEEGKFWIYLNHYDTDDPNLTVSGHAITFQGDTIINSLSYKKVYKHTLKGGHDCPLGQHPCWNFDYPYQTESKALISFIREDTNTKKVFNLPVSGNGFCEANEHLIFDFSLGIGDTINSCIYEFIGADNVVHPSWGIVDSLEVTEWFGKNRNTIFTTGILIYIGLPFRDAVLILEGVGLHIYGIFHEPLSLLVDFCEGGSEPCQLLLSNSTIERKKGVDIYPNPTKGILRISGEKEELLSIRIYSMMGEFIAEFFHTITIDIDHLEEGVYLLELISENGERIVRKIVKEDG